MSDAKLVLKHTCNIWQAEQPPCAACKFPGTVGEFRNDVLTVNLWYPRLNEATPDLLGRAGRPLPPRTPREPVAVEVGLIDVRAADSIRVEYDFERDGWIIKQASKFEFEPDDKVCDEDWREVAFVQAWGREVKTDG